MRKSDRISIIAVGDLCPGDQAIMGAGILGKTKRHGPDFPFLWAREFLKSADVTVGNLEGMLSRKVSGSGGARLRFCGLTEFAGAMRSSGFTVVNLANNHVLEHGPELFLETVQILKDAGLRVCGLRSSGEKYYSEPVIISVDGQRIGILGYNWVGVNNFTDADSYIAQSGDSLVNYTWERTSEKRVIGREHNTHVIHDVCELRKEVDLVVLMTHWGYEFVLVPPYNLTLEARSFVDAGADIIIGGHPHVIQGAEIYQKGVILYSLGNFVFDSRAMRIRRTVAAEITVTGERDISYRFFPYVVNSDFQPQQAVEGAGACIDSIIAESSQKLTSEDREILLADDALYREYERYYHRYKMQNILWQLVLAIRDPSLMIS
ncbi:MAG: CapA family protein, partial [Pseudomonadota bacterium]